MSEIPLIINNFTINDVNDLKHFIEQDENNLKKNKRFQR